MPSPAPMAARFTPRSASDATRFTSTTPHASSKHNPAASAASSAKSAASATAAGTSTSPNRSVPGGSGGNGPNKRGGASPLRGGESPEERVRRLRAAHQAAKNAQVSQVDKVVGGGRRFFDLAHRFTVAGLLGFTAIAGLISVYSVYDMVTYNRRRREDFVEAQKRIETDALSSARLAFINGSANEEQIRLVEEANEQARLTGTKLPPLLAPNAASGASDGPVAGSADVQTPALDPAQREAMLREAEGSQGQTGKSTTSSWWPFSGSGSAKGGSVVKAVEEAKDSARSEAHAAFERERENQRQGGMLDQVGLQPEKNKKSWW